MDEERDNEDFQQHLPVLDHRWNEPAEIEPGQLAENRRPRCDLQQASTVALPKHGHVNVLRALLGQIVDQYLIAIDAGDDERIAVLTQGQRRQVGERQARAGRRYHPRFETQLAGRQDQSRFVHGAIAQPSVVRQLTGVGRYAMKLSKQYQTTQRQILLILRTPSPRHQRCRVSLWHNIPCAASIVRVPVAEIGVTKDPCQVVGLAPSGAPNVSLSV
ncbi:hypothetical protein D3C72_1587070 [compost metagenome]